jgi:hypothetical protein
LRRYASASSLILQPLTCALPQSPLSVVGQFQYRRLQQGDLSALRQQAGGTVGFRFFGCYIEEKQLSLRLETHGKP